MSSYSDLLKDPRWQKKRLEILERDQFMCQNCSDTEKTLHVHHRAYAKNTKPWEYVDKNYVTLCADCHEEWELAKNFIDAALMEIDPRSFLGLIDDDAQSDPLRLIHNLAYGVASSQVRRSHETKCEEHERANALERKLDNQ